MGGTRSWLGAAVAAVLASLALVPVKADSAPDLARAVPLTRPTTDFLPLPYRVRLNGQDVGDAVFMRGDDARLLLQETNWSFWRLGIPNGEPVLIAGERYWPLDLAPGFVMKLDESAQLAELEFAPSAFGHNRLQVNDVDATRAERPKDVGGFINYEAVATQNWNRNFSDDAVLNGQVETGVFTPWGVGIGQWVGLDLDGQPEWIRLDTSWRLDDPADMSTVQVGDAIGRAGLWGRAVRFGGLQWSRNFSTQPGFVTLPQPALSGESALPSVLDVYVDGVRRESFNVPQGPFVVDNIPAVNGLGQVDVVVRDLLGREQVLSLPYLSSTRQLRAGLHDWSYEAGFLRENFGSTREDYGRFVATGLHRYGLSDSLTAEARTEVRETGQTGGLGASLSIPRVGVVSAAGAYSEDSSRSGSLAFIAWERVLRRRFSIGARSTFTSPGFVQSGMARGFAPASRLFAANAGFSLNGRAGIGVGYIDQRNRLDVPDAEAVTASLSGRVGSMTLSLQAIARLQPSEDHLVSVLLSMPLANRATVSTGYRHRQDENGNWNGQGTARMQRNAPLGEGLGYRVAVFGDADAENNGDLSAQGAASFNAAHGSYGLEAATLGDSTSMRGTVSGGLGHYRGHSFASRRISSGFGIVESGTADVPLLLNNQRVARTDAQGIAIIPNLQAYQSNQLRVDTAELPLDIEVNSDEMTVTPYYRSGMLITLPVQRVRGALLQLVTQDGAPLPAGTSLSFASQMFPVGRKGVAHVTGLVDGDNLLHAQLADGPCRLIVRVPPNTGVQPKLGPFACEMSGQ